MGLPDMRMPINYALYYPDKAINEFKSLDFFSTGRELTFEKSDMKTFKCITFSFAHFLHVDVVKAVYAFRMV